MPLTTEHHAVCHKWQGIASSIIGVTSVGFNLLLVGIVMSGIEPPGATTTALQVLSVGMLCAHLIGIVLGLVGARDRSSRQLYPRLGLTLNLAIVLMLVAMALVGLWINP